jgi:hypothetical protein
VRYGAPLAGDYAADLETNRCAHYCYERAAEAPSRFYGCLSTCPGVVRLDAATCEDPAETPEAFCYTGWVEREAESSGDSTAGNIVVQIFGAILNGLLEAAVSSGKPEHARRERREEEQSQRPPERRERPARSEPSREPRRYVPATPRRR